MDTLSCSQLGESLLGVDGFQTGDTFGLNSFTTGSNSKIFSLGNSGELQGPHSVSSTTHSPLDESIMGISGTSDRPDYNALMQANEHLRSQLAQYQQLLVFLQQQQAEVKQEPKYANIMVQEQPQTPLDDDALQLLDDDEYPFPKWTVTESTVRPYPVCIIRWDGPKNNLLVKAEPAPGYKFKLENHIAYYKSKDQNYLAPRNLGHIIVFELLHVEGIGNAEGEQIQIEFSLYNIEGFSSRLISRKISPPITVFNHSQYLPAPSITKLLPSWAPAGGTPKVDAFGPLFLRKNNILECQIAELDGTEFKLLTGNAIERKRNCFHSFTFTAPAHAAGQVVVRCRYRGRDFGSHKVFEFIQPPLATNGHDNTAADASGNYGEDFNHTPQGRYGSHSSRGSSSGGNSGSRGRGAKFGGGIIGYTYACDKDAVYKLLAESDNPALVANLQDPSNGTTALFWAAYEGFEEIAALLIEYGARVDIQNSRGETPLHAACWASRDNIVKCLLEKGHARIDVRDYHDELTPLHVAAYVGHIPILALLCQHEDADDVLASTDRDGLTPLHMAIMGQNVAAVRYLLDQYLANDLDINTKDSSGLTPLGLACSLNNTDIARELLQHLDSNSLNVKDGNGETPLFHAVRNNNLELARELCQKGASPNIADRNNRTPMFISVREKNNNITMLLLEHGADASITDVRGRQPFQALDLEDSILEGSRISVSRVAAKLYDRVVDAMTTTPKTHLVLPGHTTPGPDLVMRPPSPPLAPNTIVPFEIILPHYTVTTTGLSASEIREVAYRTAFNSPTNETPGNPAQETPGNPANETPGNPATETPGNPATETPGNPQRGSSELDQRINELMASNKALNEQLNELRRAMEEMEIRHKKALDEKDIIIKKLQAEKELLRRQVGRSPISV